MTRSQSQNEPRRETQESNSDPARGLGWRPTPPGLARALCERILESEPAVLDPSCGDGALLVAALERAGNDPEYARTSLFGIELDPERAELARERLRALSGLPPGTELDQHIQCADSLNHDWPSGTMVVANPPWVSYSGRQARGRVGEDLSARSDAAQGAAHLPSGVRSEGGWPSAHADFLLRIARHISAEGTRALILLPASMMEQERYGPCRASVAEHAHPVGEIVELGESAFPGVTEPAVMLELAPGPDPGRDTLLWSSPMPEWIDGLQSYPRMPDKTFGDPGVHSGNSARELVLSADQEQWPGLRQGRDLAAFHLGAPSARLRTDLERSQTQRFRFGSLERYCRVPVLLRQTANRPIAAEHTQPTFFRNSILACQPPAGIATSAVVAILNGPVATAWHQATTREGRQRSFPQVKVSALAKLPFPFVDRGQAARLHDQIAALSTSLARSTVRESDTTALRQRLDRLTIEAYGLPTSIAERVVEATSVVAS
ncbi:MAG: polypeptide subunit release factor methylase [Planctomycetota bacterium]